ncbi:MAG: hypothetical protein EPO01_06370 [Aquabacterium sp.]|jgi:hypothetical protein|nr:MAG: hypothetical protein EPO01_06370 [Aquabacterium sp.]
MSSDPALAVLAARIRFALQRHSHQAVDTASMLADTAYAMNVVAQCRAANVPGLTSLADQFEALLKPTGVPASRFARSDSASAPPSSSAAPAAGVASSRLTTQAPSSRPPASGHTQSPQTQAPGSAHTGEEPHDDPHDPNSPRNRRYLRGAR